MRVLFFILLALAAPVAAQTFGTENTFNEAVETARRGDFEQAAEKFRRVLLASEAEKPSNDFLARVHFNLGVCFYRLGETEKAVRQLNEAVRLSGRKYQKAFYVLGMAEQRRGKLDRAEEAFRNALKLDRADGEAWFDLAMVCLEKTEFEKAEKAFSNSIKYESRSAADAYNNLGVISALRRDFDTAEKHFETALELSAGRSPEARNNLQFCRYYRTANRFEDLLAKLEFKRPDRLEYQ
jgi:Flp pilus assembly protein TadD